MRTRGGTSFAKCGGIQVDKPRLSTSPEGDVYVPNETPATPISRAGWDNWYDNDDTPCVWCEQGVCTGACLEAGGEG